MVKFVNGDFFDYSANIRVNTVNCVGVMGAGVALEFKNKYPDMFKAYVKACKRNELEPGKPMVYDASDLFGQCIIINFPTKTHWRLPSRIEYVESGLVWLKNYLSDWGSDCKVTLPALGCGHGGLNWDEVRPMILEYLDDLSATVYTFPPSSSNPVIDESAYLDKLTQCGASLLTNDSEYYPKDLDEKKIYIKGNRELLKNPKIQLLLSRTQDPQIVEKEFIAISKILQSIDKKKYSLLINVIAKQDKEWIKMFTESGIDVISIVNEGILRAFNDVTWIEDLKEKLLVVSCESPDSVYRRVSQMNAIRGAKMSRVTLITNSDLKDIEKNWRYMAPVVQASEHVYNIKYWIGRINKFEENNIHGIGVDRETGRPDVTSLNVDLFES